MKDKPISEFAAFMAVFAIIIIAIALITVISFNAGVSHGIEICKNLE